MNELKVGDKFVMPYPFYNQLDFPLFDHNNKKEYFLTPGCLRETEEEDAGWGSRECVYWTAHCIGEINYEILSIAKMPGRYMDRVIIKYYYNLPDGNKFSNGGIKILTTGKLKKQVDNDFVFPCDYEECEHFKLEKQEV